MQIKIEPVTRDSIAELDQALRSLSSEMGDAHVTDQHTLKSAFLGDHPAFNALLASCSNAVQGVIVWSPQFSTTRGGGGVFVSDLWVASSARAQGVGRKLLTRVLSDAENTSGASFLKLAVHRTNPPALAYYEHLGFRQETDMLGMTLDGKALQSFRSAPG